MSKRTVSGFVLATALVLAGLVASGPVAGADTLAPPNCEPGYACIVDGSGTVVYKNASNANNVNYFPAGGGYVWNNGVRYPGLDHIQLYTIIGTRRYTICLHYGREPVTVQPEPTAGVLIPDEGVLSWRWRGECIGDEDTWHRI